MSISNSELNILNLVIGLPKAPGDEAESGEQGQKFVSLTGDGQTNMGFSLQTLNGWHPQIAPLKGGGAWIDNPAIEGRILTADAVGNVIETVACTLKAPTLLQAGEYITLLQRLVQEARQFMTEFFQTEPVYLEWKPIGQKVHQYALIFNIDMAITDPSTVNNEFMYSVTFTIEREPYWRIGVPPGMPAKIWTLIKNGLYSSYDKEDLAQFYDASIAPSLAEATVNNRLERDGTAVVHNARLSQNYIDIPGDDIPGDAPALMTLTTRHDVTPSAINDFARYFIGLETKPDMPIPAGLAYLLWDYYVMAGGDGKNYDPSVSTVAYTATSQGVISNGSATTEYVADVSMGSGTWAERPFFVWGINAPLYRQRQVAHRGRFIAFLRGELLSGTASDLKMFLRAFQTIFEGVTPTTPVYSQTDQDINPVAISTANRNGLFYLGEITIPNNTRQSVHMDGQGPNVTSQIFFQLWRRARTGASAMTLRIADLILIPIDEGSVVIDTAMDFVQQVGAGQSVITMMDNTGYFSRGLVRDQIVSTSTGASTLPDFNTDAMANGYVVGGGNLPMLVPGKTNRIHMITTERAITVFPAYEELSDPALIRDLEVTVNIVPRCTYLANVEV